MAEIGNQINSAIIKPKKGLNLWMIASACLGLMVLILGIVSLKPGAGITGKAVSDTLGQKLVDFLNTNIVPGGNITLSSTRDMGDIYEVNVSYNGRIVPTYISKDGKYYITKVIDINSPPQAAAPSTATNVPQNVTKTVKPTANAFVFSYCPYGLQFEKALSPAYNLLKSKAEINIVFIGAMHGEYEHVESLRQLCVQKEYGKDKLFEYLDKFNADTAIGSCSSNAACSLPLVEALMASLSIDKSKIDSCMNTDAAALYSQDMAKATSLGITGSPTFVINGVKVQPSSRSAEAIKKAICDAFITPPSECSQTLSTSAASAGFGAGTSAASSGSACGA